MGIITRMRRQDALYWAPAGRDRTNRIIYEDPIEIKCRWDEKQERDVDERGEEIMVRATVYVDRVVALGGVLWLGLLVDAPETPPEHNRIKVYREIPNLKATEIMRIARL